jgi:hypothetical protein
MATTLFIPIRNSSGRTDSEGHEVGAMEGLAKPIPKKAAVKPAVLSKLRKVLTKPKPAKVIVKAKPAKSKPVVKAKTAVKSASKSSKKAVPAKKKR